MAVRTAEEILEQIRTNYGDRTDDESIAFLEDITDTINDYENRTRDSTNWEERYNENDRQWRERYRDRFFNLSDDSDNNDNPEDNTEPKTFDDLFEFN